MGDKRIFGKSKKDRSLVKTDRKSLRELLFKPSVKSLICIVISICLNLLGRWVFGTLNLPAWGDFAGTALTAILYGPLAGAIVGAASNIIISLYYASPADMIYAIVGAVGGFVIGYYYPREKKRTDPFTISVTGFYAMLTTMILSTPINMILYDGYTGNIWGDAMVDYLSLSISLRFFCCLVGEGYVDFLDKVLTVSMVGGLIILYGRLKDRYDARKLRKEREKRRKENIALCLALFIIGAQILFAGSIVSEAAVKTFGEIFLSEYSAEIYNMNDGLTSIEMNDVVQTEDGYIWVGGYSGLYRFEGKRFYRMEIGQGISSVTRLFVDSKGDMWIGTNDVGVAKYTPSTGEIKVYDLSWGLPAESIRSIAEDVDGNIYIGTVSAMATISPSGIVGILENNARISGITDMASDNSGNVIGVTESGVLFMVRSGRVIWTGECNEPDRFYTCVTIGDRGNLLVGTSKNTIERFRIVNENMTRMETMSTGDVSYINDILYVGDIDSFLIAGENGISIIGSDRKVESLSKSGFDNSVTAAAYDYQGNFWFTSNKQGVMKFSKKPFMEIMSSSGLEPSVVNSVCTKGDDLYIGADDGLHVVDTGTGNMIGFDYLKKFKDVRVRHVMVDSGENIWVSTYGSKGLVKITPDRELIKFNEDRLGIEDARFRFSMELSDGTIVGVTNSGLCFIRDDRLVSTLGENDGLKMPRILSMVEDTDGRLYCGSDGDGIYVIEKGKVTGHIGTPDGLRSLVVLRIVPLGGSEYLYVTSNAIYYNDGVNIRELGNFPYSNNYDITITENDVCWVSSSAGFYIVHLKDLLADKPGYGYELLNFTRGFDNSLCANAWNLIFNNKLYACCSGGVEVIDTTSYNEFSSDYEVRVGAVFADDVQVHQTDDVYVIPEEATHVVIRPAVLNYALSNPLLHIYIEGIDDIDTYCYQNEISDIAVTSLRAGDYTMHVQILDEFSGNIQRDSRFFFTKAARMYETMAFKIYQVVVIVAFISYLVWIVARINNMAVINSQYDQIREARDAAERANAAKSDFLAQMSHEIRTPINSVLGMDEMILREARDPDIIGYANDIYTSGRTLLSLINDILDQSKIESGKMEIVEVDYEIASLMNDLYNMVAQRAEVKGLEFTAEVEEGMPIRYVGDDVRIRQVVVNLLTNAVKYTPAGNVWLRLKGTRIDDKRELLRFEVEDTGIGIKEEDIPHLFDEYQRFDDIKNRHIEGTGLGLGIAKRLLELMDSELMVESTYGKGTIFYFEIEQEIMDSTPIGDFNSRMKELNAAGAFVKKGDAFIAPDAEVMVVDDNAMNRRVFKSLLKHTRVKISEASGGMEAVELAKKQKFDIIFMDHMMPEVDGIDALHMIREDEDSPNHDTAIVVLTANAVTGAKEMYLDEGFNGFLSKPVAGDKLEKTIRHTLPDEKILPAPAEDSKAGMVAEPGAEVPDDLPDVEGLDWSFAWLHLPERELLEETVREFYELLPAHADKLDSMYAEILTVGDALENGAPVPPEKPITDLGDIPDKLPDPLDQAYDAYRIQVHGMKSAAATIGIVPLAGMAKMLEFAARDHDMSIIGSMHNIFIDEWRHYKEKMTGVFGVGMEDDSEKEDAIPGMLTGYAMMLRSAMENMDIDTADEIMGKLKRLRFKDEIENLLPQLAVAVADIDEDKVGELLSQMEEYDR